MVWNKASLIFFFFFAFSRNSFTDQWINLILLTDQTSSKPAHWVVTREIIEPWWASQSSLTTSKFTSWQIRYRQSKSDESMINGRVRWNTMNRDCRRSQTKTLFKILATHSWWMVSSSLRWFRMLLHSPYISRGVCLCRSWITSRELKGLIPLWKLLITSTVQRCAMTHQTVSISQT